MSLNTKKLISKLEKGLKDQEYVFFKDTILKTRGLFIKKIRPDFYLTLGLTLSRYVEDTFTCDLYLSTNTNFASVWGDIPSNCYTRIGFLLNENERIKFFGEDYEPDVLDNWWNANTLNVYDNFLNAVQCAEINFITDKLLKAIKESNDVAMLTNLSAHVISIVKNKD